MVLGIVLLLSGLAGAAQPAPRRTILGQVLDENDKALATAVVTLKNVTTKEQWTVVTGKNGRYQFNDLPLKVDYELYAESGSRKSATRKVSQFDTRERIVVNLKLQPREKPAGETNQSARP